MRGRGGLGCLQPVLDRGSRRPAHFGSLFVSTHVAYYVNYFAGQKTTTGQGRRERGIGDRG